MVNAGGHLIRGPWARGLNNVLLASSGTPKIKILVHGPWELFAPTLLNLAVFAV